MAVESGCGTPQELSELRRLIPGNISGVALEVSVVGYMVGVGVGFDVYFGLGRGRGLGLRSVEIEDAT